jgi:hypothetical protein
MSLPDFICIGAQKAGTTWLYSMLAQNPSIWMPPLKEVHYFDQVGATNVDKKRRRARIDRLARRTERSGGKGSKGDGKVELLRGLAGEDMLSEEWYRNVFSHPDRIGRISGEITPSYLAMEDEKVAYVKQLLPQAKILLIVREPRSRNISQVKMAASRSKLAEPSQADWETFLGRLAGRGLGEYSRNIPVWQKYFDPQQLLILPFGPIKTDPAGMIGAIETFIGAKPFDGYEALDEQVHKTKEVPVPDWVAERAGELAKPQIEYLINTFGTEFYEKTK